ncbi:MAG: methyltransferase domain-containing protein [Phycisphaera sp.]|nr:methyltransferase domain-containing protein [Phycisphaera sp.]
MEYRKPRPNDRPHKPRPYPREGGAKPAAAARNRRIPGLKTDWGQVADWYDEHVGDVGDEYQSKIVLPGVMRLLHSGPGERVLDVACGQGVLCRMLQERGAQAVGIDAAGPLIEKARERGPEGITYHVGDARDLSTLTALEGQKFTAVACVLAIQNLNPVGPVFEGVAKLLVDGGRFVFAMMHPCFRVPKSADWGWDADRKVQYRRVDRYLLPRKEPIITHPGIDPSVYTWTFHRPLQAYVKALSSAGLLIDTIEEWPSHKHSDSGPRAKAENEARREIPLFMAIRALKRQA